MRSLLIPGILLCVAVSAGASALAQQTIPSLSTRTNPEDPTSISQRITSPITLPGDVSGPYQTDRALDTIELDLDQNGLSGYMTVSLGHHHDVAPLEFFFAQSTIGGDRLAFTTHQVHRTWYEFAGTVIPNPKFTPRPGDPPLRGEKGYYILTGSLTTHTIDPSGAAHSITRTVRFPSAGTVLR
jgi:hypothetical protein